MRRASDTNSAWRTLGKSSFGYDPLFAFFPPERRTSALYAFQDEEATWRSNVARDVAHHTPPGKDGYEVVECRQNAASTTSFELHEAFAREVLASVLPGPDDLSCRALMNWVERKMPAAGRRLLNTGA